MSEQAASYPELPSIISLLIERIGNTALARHLVQWESVIFSLLTGFILFAVVYYAQRDRRLIPARLQNAVEVIVLSIDDFVCGILGPQGRKHVPFIGTVFLYILCMNFLGVVPFMRSATSNFSSFSSR